MPSGSGHLSCAGSTLGGGGGTGFRRRAAPLRVRIRREHQQHDRRHHAQTTHVGSITYSRFAVRGSQFAVRGSRFAVREKVDIQ